VFSSTKLLMVVKIIPVSAFSAERTQLLIENYLYVESEPKMLEGKKINPNSIWIIQ
jgi:hypothetical protein